MFFCRYDVDANMLLDRHETNKVMSDHNSDKKPANKPGNKNMQYQACMIFAAEIKYWILK